MPPRTRAGSAPGTGGGAGAPVARLVHTPMQYAVPPLLPLPPLPPWTPACPTATSVQVPKQYSVLVAALVNAM